MFNDEKIRWYEYVGTRVKDFVSDWVYPGYKLINCLVNRFDIVKLHKYKASDYVEVTDRLFEANMELIKYFYENECEYTYTLWYKDKNSDAEGPKYGDDKKYLKWLYPELNGKYIMDIIKDIYNWYTVTYNDMKKDSEYILDVCDKYFVDRWIEQCEDNKELSRIESKHKTYTKEELEKLDIDWSRILKYTDGKTMIDIANADSLQELYIQTCNKIYADEQYYLHLCIEVRPCLWS